MEIRTTRPLNRWPVTFDNERQDRILPMKAFGTGDLFCRGSLRATAVEFIPGLLQGVDYFLPTPIRNRTFRQLPQKSPEAQQAPLRSVNGHNPLAQPYS
jgi:hypothetical protein